VTYTSTESTTRSIRETGPGLARRVHDRPRHPLVTTALLELRAALHGRLSDPEWTVNAYNPAFACTILTGADLGRLGTLRFGGVAHHRGQLLEPGPRGQDELSPDRARVSEPVRLSSRIYRLNATGKSIGPGRSGQRDRGTRFLRQSGRVSTWAGPVVVGGRPIREKRGVACRN
jgi:hypothetical protein